MQGQRGTPGSLAETLEFELEYGLTQSTATTGDQHIFWNDILSPNDMNPSYMNVVNNEWQNLSGWSLGEPSSSNTHNEVNNNEQKREQGLSSSLNGGAIAGPRLEQRCLEPTNDFLLNNINSSSMFMGNSNSHLVSQNLNLDAGLPDIANDNSHNVVHPNLHMSSVPVNEPNPPAIDSGSFLLPSGSNNIFVESIDGRLSGCSIDTRRVSCKRKEIEQSVGQSSDGGSSSYTQHTDGSVWNTLPTQDYTCSIFNRSALAEQVNSRRLEPTNDFSLDNINSSPMYMGNSSSHFVSQNLNLNAGLPNIGNDNSYNVVHPNFHMSSVPVNEHNPYDIGSGSNLLPSGSNNIFVESIDGRLSGCSIDTRRVSCKRKEIEQSVGQSSDGGSSSYTQHTDGSVWNTLPTQDYTGRIFNRFELPEQVNSRRLEPTNDFSLDNVNSSSMYMGNSNSQLVSQNLNLNASLPDIDNDNSYNVVHPNLHMSSVLVNEPNLPAIGSGSNLLPFGSNNIFVESTDGRRSGCSLDTRRVSCKRKAIEQSVGQSSDGGSSSYTQHTDGSVWNTLPTQDYTGSIFNRFELPEQVNSRRLEPTNDFSLDNVNSSSMYMGNSNSQLVSQNLNLNASLPDIDNDNSYNVVLPNLHMSSVLVNEPNLPAIGSGSNLLPFGSNNIFVESTDGRRSGCSLDTRRVSCKRKAIEQSVGQSSNGGSSSYTQHTDGSVWNTLPTQNYTRSIFNRSAPEEQVNSRLGLNVGVGASASVPESYVAGSSTSFHRNFHLRVNPSNQQIHVSPTIVSNGSAIRSSIVPSPPPILQRFDPVSNSLDLRPVPPLVDALIPQSQPLLVQSAALPRNTQPFRWSGGSSSTNNHSSNPVISIDRDNRQNEEWSSRNMPQNILEHPIFVPPTNLRNVVQNPTRAPTPTIASLSIPRNIASSSQTVSSLTSNPTSSLAWDSRPNPQHYPCRLSEYAHRSLYSPSSAAAGSASNTYSSLHGPPTSSESRGLSSGVNLGRTSWLDRSADSSLRSLAAAGEGGNGRVSELRNMLGLMRRDENLRLEDVMLLNHSMIANMHDRHRDMRLDVDNMSYEELLALEERIGNVNTGLSEEIIMKLLKQKKYSAELSYQGGVEPCCVCQEEYNEGDELGSLDCGHVYHTGCIKQWLMHKNVCPICKTTGLAK